MTILTKESIVLFLAHVKNYHKKRTTFLQIISQNHLPYPTFTSALALTLLILPPASLALKIKRPPVVRRSFVRLNGDWHCCVAATASLRSLGQPFAFDWHRSVL